MRYLDDLDVGLRIEVGSHTPSQEEAVELARRLGPGHRIVTVLCDGGDRYRSRIWNKEWLQSRGLRQPERQPLGSVA